MIRRLLVAILAVAALAGAPRSLFAQQDTAASNVVVDSIVVRGNHRVSDTRVIELSHLRKGESVSFPTIQSAIHRLYASGQFANVSISVTPGSPAIFFIEVVERPVVAEYAFEGLQHVSPGTVRDTAGLVNGEPLDPARISRAEEMLGHLLSKAGFPRPRIDTAMVVAPGGYRLVFRVDEGPRLAITSISFEGDSSFSDAQLRSAMSTGQEGFLWLHTGEFRHDEFEKDLRERLPAFYAEHGYIDMSVAGDTVLVDPRTGKGRIVVKVDEGPQYRLAEFDVHGNRRFPTGALMSRFRPADAAPLDSLPRDELPPFDQSAFDDATGKIGDLYRNAGYLRAEVQPSVQRIPPSRSGGAHLVKAVWNITEGEPAYVHKVTITGNTYTHDYVIRQQLGLLPGDIYSQERLIQSVKNIQSMGFFEALPPQQAVNIQPLDNGDVDITLKVKEKQTGNLNFGASASAVTGLAGFIGYDQPNLFGEAKSGHFRWLFGGRTQDIELGYQDPSVMGSRYSASVQLRHSRDIYTTYNLGQRRQTGGSLEVGLPVFGLRGTRLFAGYSLFRDETRDLQLVGLTPQQANILLNGTRSTVSLRLVRDTRQGGLFPVAGSRNEIDAAFTGGPLGGAGRYGKYTVESSWFVPVAAIGGGLNSQPIQFTAGLTFRGGVILGNNPFFRERFLMGGVQVGEQLRGYSEGTVTPYGHVPQNSASFPTIDRAGESFFGSTAQFGVKLSGSLFADAFVDAGNVWKSAADINPTDLLVGAGVGVSLVTPFGPLGIDYAYGFDRRDVLGRPNPGWKLHFKFGRIF
ncbi:MAG: outer membrane protein assembly factor BamA [Candidatus Palauibacterales bacterium]|nr:outer membrane protein assembly factor BamA [Candidatus Palauibacterales bacterium]MDP2529414.1 outer membrane protein assembly factor BamA [Candidatus Palauibacterales bacterium]MDP2583179.1 outer membrane protein assembly factor BamA [Candidatus Palauibacterales bacterium]